MKGFSRIRAFRLIRDARRAMTAIHKTAQLIKSGITLREASHEDDNRFLECAQTSKAHYLVTGNSRHFPDVWKYTKVVRPRAFLMQWQVQRPLGGKA